MGGLSKSCVTPIEAHSLGKIIEAYILKNRRPDHVLSNNTLRLATTPYAYAQLQSMCYYFGTGGNFKFYGATCSSSATHSYALRIIGCPMVVAQSWSTGDSGVIPRTLLIFPSHHVLFVHSHLFVF